MKLQGNQAYELQLTYEARNWTRLGMQVGLFGTMQYVPHDELKLRLRQVRRYAAELPAGLRCSCRRNPRALRTAQYHWPCCPEFVPLAPFDPYRRVGPWDLPEDQ